MCIFYVAVVAVDVVVAVATNDDEDVDDDDGQTSRFETHGKVRVHEWVIRFSLLKLGALPAGNVAGAVPLLRWCRPALF